VSAGTRPRPVARAPSRLGPALRLPSRDRRAAVAAVAIPAAIVTAAALLRAWGLGRQGLWYDEAVTAWLLRGTPAQMLSALPHSESTPPLYYLLAWSWVRLFGDTAAGLRALSAVAGTATVAVVFAAGRSLVSRRVGLIAAALVAVNPLLLWYSQEARSYALLVLLGALALWLALRVREEPTPGRLLAWALGAALALATHYFAAFVVAPQAVLVLAQRRAALRWRLLALGLVAAAAIPLVQLALVQRTRTYWFLARPLSFRADQIVQQFLVGFRPPATATAVLVAGAAAGAAGAVLVVRGAPAERRAAALAALLGLTAVGLPLALALAGADYVNTRNVLGALVPLLLAVACGLGVRRAPVLGLGVAAVLVGVSLWAIAALAHDPLARRPPWRQVATALEGGMRPRALLLEGSRTWARPLGLLLPRTWWLGPGGARVREIDVVRRLPAAGDCPGATWWGADCDVGARATLARPPGGDLRLVARRRVAGFEVARFLAARPVLVVQGPSRHRRLLLTPTRVPIVP
jgi:mannosyltransferase